jgi:tetratricopeptide (TPR) repeat protein
MSPQTSILDDQYRRYADLLLRHHRLLSEGKDEEPATEAVEEEMTRLWERLDEHQRRSLSGLGSDLSWLRHRCQLAPRSRRPEEVTADDFEALIQARNAPDWEGVLQGLRLCAPRMPPFQLAFLRGSAWDALNVPQVASVFYDLASALEPSHGLIAVLALHAAERADPEAALARAQKLADDPLSRPAAVVALAIALLIREAERRGSPIDRPRVKELLRRSLARLSLEPASDAERVMAYQVAAFGLESVDEVADALQCYEEAVRLAPTNYAAWSGLGLLLYGRDSKRAADAFTRAAELSSPRVYPYFFLAHYHLSRREFERALDFCSQAWRRATLDPVRADLLEWSAICQSELAYPDEAVRALFQRAVELDPGDERIVRNLHAFEAARQAGSQLRYDVEPDQSLRVRHAREAGLPLTPAAA